ncbi:MAG TPA: hypothetical protein VFX23_01395 [Limnobacter sp.]|uniref:hypothetical protein n=1 Tax=Limnobacter sp. TaxID=2003368 RepID=UPI002E302476|nr:hypothetical protein [Limnobacter sp.]HEX5484625.1 hypothetical protein [Limnobacter sp.]
MNHANRVEREAPRGVLPDGLAHAAAPRQRATPAQENLLRGNAHDIDSMMGLLNQVQNLRLQALNPNLAEPQRQAARARIVNLAAQLDQHATATLDRIATYERDHAND